MARGGSECCITLYIPLGDTRQAAGVLVFNFCVMFSSNHQAANGKGLQFGGCSASDLLGRVFLEGGWRWCCFCSHLVTHEESCSQESLYQRLRHGVCRYKMFPLRRVSLDCVVFIGSWERGSAKALFRTIPTLSKVCVQSAAPEVEPRQFLGCVGNCLATSSPSLSSRSLSLVQRCPAETTSALCPMFLTGLPVGCITPAPSITRSSPRARVLIFSVITN